MRSTFIGKLDIFHWSHRVILSVSTNWFWYWKYWIWMSRHMLSRHIGWAVIIYADIGLAAMLAIMYLPTFTTTYILYIWHTVRVWKCIPNVIHLELFVIRYINMLLLRLLIFYNKQFKRKCYYCFRGVCPSDKRSNGQSKYLY